MSSALYSAGRENESLLEKNVILTECASEGFHFHGAVLGPHSWGECMLVVIRVLWSVCSREMVGQTDGQTDTKGGLEQEVAHGLTEAQGSHRQPSACLGLLTRLQEAKGWPVTAGAVQLWGSSEAGPGLSVSPAIHPGARAHSRLPPRIEHAALPAERSSHPLCFVTTAILEARARGELGELQAMMRLRSGILLAGASWALFLFPGSCSGPGCGGPCSRGPRSLPRVLSFRTEVTANQGLHKDHLIRVSLSYCEAKSQAAEPVPRARSFSCRLTDRKTRPAASALDYGLRVPRVALTSSGPAVII